MADLTAEVGNIQAKPGELCSARSVLKYKTMGLWQMIQEQTVIVPMAKARTIWALKINNIASEYNLKYNTYYIVCKFFKKVIADNTLINKLLNI